MGHRTESNIRQAEDAAYITLQINKIQQMEKEIKEAKEHLALAEALLAGMEEKDLKYAEDQQ